MQPARALALLALGGLALTACAGGPSPADLPEGDVRYETTVELVPGPLVPAEGTDIVGGGGVVPPVRLGPVEAFRAFASVCGEFAALTGRGDPAHPRVEPDRFAGATLLQEIDDDTARVTDGRGTVLLVDTWTTTPALRPDGAGELPDPYRLGCPPEPVLLQEAPAVPAPDGG